MKTKLTLAALLATSIAATVPFGTSFAQTNSPNPNKAQNSDMRTQSGAYGTYVYPSGTYLYMDRGYMNPGTSTYVIPSESPSTVWVVPAPSYSEPVAGTRNVYVPSREIGSQNTTTNTPNPNKVQNNGVPTQYDTYDTYYIYRIDTIAP
jgi:hypothetical protein